MTHSTASVPQRVIAVATAICLAVALVTAGLFACLLPPTTTLLSKTFSAFDLSPYEHDDLVDLALASRNFTVDPYTNGEEAALNILDTQTLIAAAHSSSDESAKSGAWSTAAKACRANEALAERNAETIAETARNLASISDRYALDEDAISHLKDCNKLINTALPILYGCCALALFGIAFLAIKKQKRTLGNVLRFAPLVLIAAFAALGLWAFIDFEGFFAAFHGLFFPQGNWMFNYDSLLICMYPEGFWMGMGCIWLVVTVLACIICMVIGSRLFKRAR